MFYFVFLLCGLLQVSSLQPSKGSLLETHRVTRQLGLGNLLGIGNKQVVRNGPTCEGPGGLRGKCLPMEQCVLKALDDDYIKNKEYFCAIRRQGPVGVCCPNSVAKPVTYSEGMFGTKNTVLSRVDEDAFDTTPADVETF